MTYICRFLLFFNYKISDDSWVWNRDLLSTYMFMVYLPTLTEQLCNTEKQNQTQMFINKTDCLFYKQSYIFWHFTK
jgi:hypothetical protein